MPTIFSSSANKKTIVNDAPVLDVAHHTIMTPLTAFAVAPDGVRFETQEPEEEVLLFLRQHPIVLFPSVLLVIVLAIAPLFLIPFLLRFLELPLQLPTGYIVVGTAFWYVTTFGVGLVSFLRWFFNIYIVTNRRIVDIDFIHLLYKEFSEAKIDKVQDIAFRSGGIFAAFFDYGNVYVQTAAEVPNIEFLTVPQPAKVVETISELIEQQKRNV